MAAPVEKSCSMLVWSDKPAALNEIKEALEGGDALAKQAAMKSVIMLLLNGENLSPQIFITIVRYVLPSEDHLVQKLLLLYMEIIDKTDSSGKLLPEMILICQNLRNNLQHPNEYIRGVTLRFLCRIKELEIVDPLIPSILANLEHRHSFVRRNAVLAIDSIYKNGGEQMLVDAPETIEKFLSTESDLSARRNAFLMLYNNAQDRAVHYLLSNVEQVTNWGDILQTVVLDLIKKVLCERCGPPVYFLRVLEAASHWSDWKSIAVDRSAAPHRRRRASTSKSSSACSTRTTPP